MVKSTSKLTIALIICLLIVIVPVIQVLFLKFLDPPFTVRTAWSWIYHAITWQGYERSYEWRTLNQISPYLRKAVLAGEDQRFVSHNGIDFIELEKALREMEDGERIRGASTISMQTARTVFLWSGRNWLRKIVEAYYTVLLELILSKERILELYLNTVDWGVAVMGAEAASRKYFHTSASGLSRAQAALLAAILPNPKSWSPTNPSRYVRKRQQFILRYMDHMPLLAR